MIKILFSAFIYLTSFHLMACELSLPSHLLKLKDKLQYSDLEKKGNCGEELVQNILNKIANIEGRVLTQTLSSEVSKITPRAIQVSSLETFLNKELLNSDGLRFFKAKTLMSKSFTELNEDLNINCLGCDSPGEKQIQLRSNDKLIVITSVLKRKTSFFIAARDISPFDSNLGYQDFIVKTDYIETNTTPFAIDEKVEFFKTLRFIKKGQVIESSMLMAKNLIRMGSKVSVLFQNSDVSIKGSGFAKRSGKYGEYIELVNPSSNKKITAKIIDFNKAIVDL